MTSQDEKVLIVPAEKAIDRAVKVVKSGGIVAYPTESSYGLGVDPSNIDAIKKIFRLKGRPVDMALPLIAGDMAALKALTNKITPLGKTLIKKFWPGPLTLIFEARENTPRLITGGGNGVGIRISSYPLCALLATALGRGITSTSANPTGRPPALDADEVQRYFKGKINLIMDNGRLAGGPASTVVDARGDKPIILRQGIIKANAVLKALEDDD